MTGMLNLDDVHRPVAALLAEQLEQVSLIFERQLASDMSAVNTLCLHVEQYRGKMLRPTLVLLSGLAAGSDAAIEQSADLTIEQCGEMTTEKRMDARAQAAPQSTLAPSHHSTLTDKHRIVAAVVEMIHMATLVHDDV